MAVVVVQLLLVEGRLVSWLAEDMVGAREGPR